VLVSSCLFGQDLDLGEGTVLIFHARKLRYPGPWLARLGGHTSRFSGRFRICFRIDGDQCAQTPSHKSSPLVGEGLLNRPIFLCLFVAPILRVEGRKGEGG